MLTISAVYSSLISMVRSKFKDEHPFGQYETAVVLTLIADHAVLYALCPQLFSLSARAINARSSSNQSSRPPLAPTRCRFIGHVRPALSGALPAAPPHRDTSILRICNTSGPSWRNYWMHYADKRKAEAERIRQKYPDRIPVRQHWPCSRRSVYRSCASG